MSTTTTKRISHYSGIPVATINTVSRELGIADYEPARHSWTVPTSHVPALVAHIHELDAADALNA